MSRARVILDCDPGHDDAVAILMAAKYCELLGITTVSGNVPLELTSHNALITVQILGLEIPVHAGAPRPLVAEAKHAEFIHGETGLGGPELPPLALELASHDAVGFIIDTLRRVDDVWLVPTGPLTNIALALRAAPDIAGRIKGISLMGGGVGFGNITPMAEFNIWADPEAAAIVFASGVPLIMCGLNVTHQFMITAATVQQIRALEGRAARFVADMLEFYSEAYSTRFFGKAEGPLHDPCAVLAISHPELFTLATRHAWVELNGVHTRGMTVVDERGVKDSQGGNVRVAYQVDAERATALLLESVRAYP